MQRSGIKIARLLSLGAVCLALAAPQACTQDPPPDGDVSARVVSGRADTVTGGDTLIEISGALQVLQSEHLSLWLNDQDVTSELRPVTASGARLAYLDGLADGDNPLAVRVGDESRFELTLTNFPITGPVFSGPHQEPWVCQTEEFALGPPLDGDCTAATTVNYLYRSTEPVPPMPPGAPLPGHIPPPGFKPYDPDAPRPADMAQTMTNDGQAIDYIVRRETGTINRGIYNIAFLHVPGEPLPEPGKSVASWNGRLVYSFGGGCAAGYRQGLGMQVIDDVLLAAGYAIATSSLNVLGNNCNDVISAESMMMVREHFIEQFGEPVHTIGSGGSGGAIQQHQIAQNYPGLLDGIIPIVSYPDASTLTGALDCPLLATVFAGDDESWTDVQKTAVSGFATWATCETWNNAFTPALIQPHSCDAVIPAAEVYDAASNPAGLRCDMFENIVNLIGRDTESGRALRAIDNVGIQYGLTAFNDGTISAEQFVTLNERVGGYDRDGNLVPSRSEADLSALSAIYRSGRLNSAGGSLGSIPILDLRVYLDPMGDIHDSIRSYAMRERLIAANGHADNQIIFVLPPQVKQPGAGEMPDFVGIMDSWLDNIAADVAPGLVIEKVFRNRPNGFETDVCLTAGGEMLADEISFGGEGPCSALYPAAGDPKIVAGAPLAGDVLKCQLKPIDADDYVQALTESQMSRLEAVFPGGVCDFMQPGIGQQPLAGTWQRF